MKTIRIIALLVFIGSMACSGDRAKSKNESADDQVFMENNKEKSDSKSGIFPIVFAGSIQIVQSLYLKKN